jgi:hypothetical protein
MMNLREARREVIDLKEEESRVVLEGVDMAIPKDLFGVGRKLGEDKNSWQREAYRLLPAFFGGIQLRKKGEDLIVFHNQRLGIMGLSFSKSVEISDRERIINEVNQRRSIEKEHEEKWIYNQELKLQDSFLQIVVWGEVSGLGELSGDVLPYFSLAYPDNFSD